MSAPASSHARSSLQDHTDPSIHVFAPRLLNMCNHLPRPRILTARLLCIMPSFLASPKPSVHASHSLTSLKTGSRTRTPLTGVRPSTRSHTSSRLPIASWLFLGRVLDAQKYFHAVTYAHRLRDSPSDVYQFRTCIGSPFHSGELSPPPITSPRSQGTSTPTPDARTDKGSPSNEGSKESDPGKHEDATAILGSDADAAEDVLSVLPAGVFTLLTDCYSPTCCKDRLCYYITVRGGSCNRAI